MFVKTLFGHPYLGHANDMALVSIDGQTYMFVIAWSSNGATQEIETAIVKLIYTGNSYYEVARYPISNGIKFAGISFLEHLNGAERFFLYNGTTNYEVDSSWWQRGGEGSSFWLRVKISTSCKIER